MAHGSTANAHTKEVRDHSLSLEISPSKSSPQSPIAHGGSRAVGHGVKHTTGKLAHGSTTRPKPRGTKTHMGKKDLMAGKSHGR